MEDTHVHALDYLSVFLRRKWWLLLPIAASIAIGALLVRYLPKQFRSSATVAVAASGVSTSLVGQSAPLDNEERLRAVSQQLLSSTTLSRVALEERLAADGADEGVIGKLRSSVSFMVPDPVATTSEPRHLDTFIISYVDADPVRAQRITNRLANVFVDESSKAREQRAERTSTFIAGQLAASLARMADLEARLRRAKETHIGQLPEQTQANTQTLSGLRTQIDTSATSLRGEQDRLAMIEHQLDGLMQGSTAVVSSRAGGGIGDSPTPETRVQLLQRELGTARLTYTDKHPEVVRLQDELATARKEVVADRRQPAADRAAQLQTDPVYRQLTTDREMSNLRIRELARAESDIRRQVGVYQSRVESAPLVEQQLASVQRDYDLEKQQYADLSSKGHAASMAESVERNRRGEQFTVLYPASYPSEPIKPVPLRVMLFSIVGGICLGAALTLGREHLDRSVHNVRELRDELDLPVLGAVPRIQPV